MSKLRRKKKYTIEEQRIIQRMAIDHYTRMIEWAKTQRQTDQALLSSMESAIKEGWYADYCPYCKYYKTGEIYDFRYDCGVCPLDIAVRSRNGFGPSSLCCGRLWRRMDRSKTWKTWVKRAEKVMEFIETHGVKEVK